jgi:hypothetical protein
VHEHPNDDADPCGRDADNDATKKRQSDHLQAPVVHCFAALQAGQGIIANPSPDSTLPLPSHLGQIAGFGVGAGSGAGVGV